jgi:hypothetical protein
MTCKIFFFVNVKSMPIDYIIKIILSKNWRRGALIGTDKLSDFSNDELRFQILFEVPPALLTHCNSLAHQ